MTSPKQPAGPASDVTPEPPDERKHRTAPGVPPALLAAVEGAEKLVLAMSDVSGPRARLPLEERILEPLSPSARTIALCLATPTASHSLPAPDDLERLTERRDALLGGAALIGEAIVGNVRDIRSLDRLWHDLRYGPTPVSFAVATTLAVARDLPLAVIEPRYVANLPEGHVNGIVGLAAGNAARAGCGQALGFVRKTLATYDGNEQSRALCIGVLKGLGNGLLNDGLSWLAQYSERAFIKQDEWAEASLSASTFAAEIDNDQVFALTRHALLACSAVDMASERLNTVLVACQPQQKQALLDRLWSSWTTWSPPVRAALLKLRGVPAADTDLADNEDLLTTLPWTRDRGVLVAKEALEQLQGRQDPLAKRILSAMLGLLDHPDADLRRLLTTLLASLEQGRVPRSLPAPPGAEVVALPPALMARTELDRLRAAIATGDSELLDEIVARLSPEQQTEAAAEMLAAMEIPDMALRRSIVAAVGRIGDAAMAPQLIEAARRYRTLEGSVASALKVLGATDSVKDLGEVFARRLKWADDQALADFCELAGDERSGYLLSAIETRFYPAARAGAARAVAETRLQEGIFALRKMSLSDPQEDARLAATAGLKTLGCTLPSTDELAGYALLFRPIADLDEAVTRALEAGSTCLPGIRKTMAKGSWKRRRAACEVLAGIKHDDAEVALVEVLTDLDEDVRLSALQALSQRGWSPSDPREHTLAAIAARQPASLIKTPERLHIPTLEEALKLGGHVFRNEVLDVLERTPDWVPSEELMPTILVTRLDGRGAIAHGDGKSGVQAVLTALDRTWQEIPHRARLTRAIGNLSTGALSKLSLQEGLGWRAREAICHALHRVGEDAAAEVATRFVHDDDDDVRKAALQALARIGTHEAAKGCATGARSPFREDRKPAASALATIGVAALPILQQLADSSWWEERHLVASALAEWRGDLQEAADMLVVLAADPVHRVSQIALDALDKHGIMPSPATFSKVLATVQLSTVDRLEQWLSLGPTHALDETERCEVMAKTLDALPNVQLAQRVGLVARFRAAPLTGWLREKADSPHFGVRLAASEALRAMSQLSCHICEGRGSIGCPGCEGEGDQMCQRCEGSGMTRVACPEEDCNAHETTRAIHSKPCRTCRGRGVVAAPCECGSGGTVTCALCHGSGRNRCPLCEGSGEPWARQNP